MLLKQNVPLPLEPAAKETIARNDRWLMHTPMRHASSGFINVAGAFQPHAVFASSFSRYIMVVPPTLWYLTNSISQFAEQHFPSDGINSGGGHNGGDERGDVAREGGSGSGLSSSGSGGKQETYCSAMSSHAGEQAAAYAAEGDVSPVRLLSVYE